MRLSRRRRVRSARARKSSSIGNDFFGFGMRPDYIWLDKYIQTGALFTCGRAYMFCPRGGPMTTESVQALKAHVAIHVRNVSASIDFYRKLVGIEPSQARTGYAKFDVANPPLNFTLNEDADAGRG